jgi:hypothetical protein
VWISRALKREAEGLPTPEGARNRLDYRGMACRVGLRPRRARQIAALMSIKRPEMLDECTRRFIESLAMPGVEQAPRKQRRKAVKPGPPAGYKPANGKLSGRAAVHALFERR